MDVFPDFDGLAGISDLREVVGALLMFALIIAVLIWRLFHLTLRLSAQNAKIEDIAQRMALDANERESKQ